MRALIPQPAFPRWGRSDPILAPIGSLGKLEAKDRPRVWYIGPIPRSKMAIFLSYGRTSPVSLCRTHNNRAPYAVEVAGGGRSSAINRRMSAKRFFGMATSAIWNAT